MPLQATAMNSRPDKLGSLIAAIIVSAAVLPFATLRANRIVLGEGMAIWQSLPGRQAVLLLAVLGMAAVGGMLVRSRYLRLGLGIVALTVVMLMMGQAGDFLTPEGNNLARVSPAGGFWLLVFGLVLGIADALTRLNLNPWLRILGVLLACGALMALLASGHWDSLSLLKEYGARAAAFWREAQRHLLLAFGSLAAAVFVGLPVGFLCYRINRLREFILNLLNIIQTIPSMAVFGLLIAPLAWVAATFPIAAASGVSGIGAAPALVALFAYSLLPVVSNTVIGLQGVPEKVRDAAYGMGMTRAQVFLAVEAPLAFPVILTGIRIVLVQNIGLATIAGLIGGGGFGVFVFQGMGQTATDLILLGALPTVLLATASAVFLDAMVELSETSGTRRGN